MTSHPSDQINATILAIGDELILGECVDTNSSWLATELAAAGVMTIEHRTVRDDRHEIAAAVGELATGSHVLILTGGLGPTADDVTREGLGDVIDPGRDLVVDADAQDQLARWFADRSRSMPQSNHRQTMRPVSMQIVENPHGTAPGLRGTLGGCLVFSLPGPPREMKPMFLDHVVPALAGVACDRVIVSGLVGSFGLGEALAAEHLKGLIGRHDDATVGITASQGIVTARIRCDGATDDASSRVTQLQEEIVRRWTPYAFAGNDQSLAAVVGELLNQRGLTLVTAESCTGGWLGKMLVDIAGSSTYYRGGWVTYHNDLKKLCLGVPPQFLEPGGPGAVSEESAHAMAEGALQSGGAQCSLAITGIAGPEGGSDDKPVGTVFIALARQLDESVRTTVRQFEFGGDRAIIRHRAALTALQTLRFSLLDPEGHPPMLWERLPTTRDAEP